MKMQKNVWQIKEMALALEVTRSGYYKFLKANLGSRFQENEILLAEIKKSHEASRETYGSPRIHKDVSLAGHGCSRKRVARLMQEAGIVAKMQKKFKVTTQVDPKLPVAGNHLQQDFKAMGPNEKWVADITYVWTLEGWLYLAIILDLFSRKVVGMAMSDRLKKEIVLIALTQALGRREVTGSLLHHSDKGCQYTSMAFRDLLEQRGILCSMSGTGNCYDNAGAESFFHTLKTEHIYFEEYKTREEAKQSIFEYVEVFYNNQRRHSFLDYVSPSDFENEYQIRQNFSLLGVN